MKNLLMPKQASLLSLVLLFILFVSLIATLIESELSVLFIILFDDISFNSLLPCKSLLLLNIILLSSSLFSFRKTSSKEVEEIV